MVERLVGDGFAERLRLERRLDDVRACLRTAVRPDLRQMLRDVEARLLERLNGLEAANDGDEPPCR